jgi:neuromedin U receptor 1
MENSILDDFLQKWPHPIDSILTDTMTWELSPNATNISTDLLHSFSNNNMISTVDEVGIAEMYGPTRDPLYVVIPITIIYLIIFITGFVGNICTCIVIFKNRNMHTATNYYLFSLAVSDFLLLVTGMPQEMFFIWSKYPYVFGEWFCILRGLCAETSTNATVLTITAFTIEGYVAICHPFLSHTLSKLSRAVKFIIMVWIVSISEL